MAAGTINRPISSTIQTLSVTLTTGVSGSLSKVGNICRLDLGIASSSNPVSLTSGNNTLGTIPSEARPPANMYFPVLYRITNDSTFYHTYGAIYTNGTAAIYMVASANVRQLVFGSTFIV